ncbi:uncharacterized protein ACR2FA_002603 [Aphomia sociella]
MKVFLLALFVGAALAAPVDEDIFEPVEVVVNGLAEGEALEIGDIVDIKLKEHVNNEIVSATNLLHPFSAAGLAEAAAEQDVADVPELAPNPIDLVPLPVIDPEVAPNPIDLVPLPVIDPDFAHNPIDLVPLPVIDSEAPNPIDLVPLPVIDPEVAPNPIDLVPLPVIDPDFAPNPIDLVPLPVIDPEAPNPIDLVPLPVIDPDVALNPIDLVPLPVVVPEVVDDGHMEILPVPAPQIPQGEIYNDGLVQVTVNTSEEPGLLETLQSWFNMAINLFNNGVQTTQQIV